MSAETAKNQPNTETERQTDAGGATITSYIMVICSSLRTRKPLVNTKGQVSVWQSAAKLYHTAANKM